MEKLEERKDKTKQEIELASPLVWAYMGDAIYESYIRCYLVNTTNLKPHKLHVEATKFVKAQVQAQILLQILPELTEKEKDIVRRARNTKNHHLPKNANLAEYAYATAFEGLIGYLYLMKEEIRLEQILQRCIIIKKQLTNGL